MVNQYSEELILKMNKHFFKGDEKIVPHCISARYKKLASAMCFLLIP
jgi:hypothetical protein